MRKNMSGLQEKFQRWHFSNIEINMREWNLFNFLISFHFVPCSMYNIIKSVNNFRWQYWQRKWNDPEIYWDSETHSVRSCQFLNIRFGWTYFVGITITSVYRQQTHGTDVKFCFEATSVTLMSIYSNPYSCSYLRWMNRVAAFHPFQIVLH